MRQLIVKISTFILLVMLALTVPAARKACAGEGYTIAVVPQFPPSVIKRDWTPLVKRLEELTGVILSMRFYRSIPEFEADFVRGVPDFVYMNPYHAVMAQKAQGYIPLIRDSNSQLVGILVVRKDSAVRSLKDLDGAVIAFPSPNAFAASLYMRALLAEQEGLRITPKYVTTHSNVYRHVVLGTALAGGGVNRTLNKEQSELRDQLRILYHTPGVAPHPFCVHPRVPAAVQRRVTEAFLSLADEASARELLKSIELVRPVRADFGRDYEPLVRLQLEKFVVQGGD